MVADMRHDLIERMSKDRHTGVPDSTGDDGLPLASMAAAAAVQMAQERYHFVRRSVRTSRPKNSYELERPSRLLMQDTRGKIYVATNCGKALSGVGRLKHLLHIVFGESVKEIGKLLFSEDVHLSEGDILFFLICDCCNFEGDRVDENILKISKSRVPIVPVVYNVLDLGSFRAYPVVTHTHYI